MPVSYQLGKIYTIENDVNDTIYLGSTAQKLLSSRMSCHRRLAGQPDRNSRLYMAMKEIGIDRFKIILHHAFPCTSKDALEAEEYKTLQAIIAAKGVLYNTRLEVNAVEIKEETKKKIAATLFGRFRGEDSRHFCSGSQSYHSKAQKWTLEWYDDGKKTTKSFSAKKWGYWNAKDMIEAHRALVYPQWIKSPEEEFSDALLRMEV
jgi:hypothetical protein